MYLRLPLDNSTAAYNRAASLWVAMFAFTLMPSETACTVWNQERAVVRARALQPCLRPAGAAPAGPPRRSADLAGTAWCWGVPLCSLRLKQQAVSGDFAGQCCARHRVRALACNGASRNAR